MAEHLFQATTVWTGAEQGGTTSYDDYSRQYEVRLPGKSTLVGSANQAFRGDPTLTDPEDLLLSAVSACHLLSYLALCARRGVVVVGYEDQCRARMTFHEGKMRIVEAHLDIRVQVAEGTDIARAESLHAEANAQCFIANSVNFPVHHRVTTAVAH